MVGFVSPFLILFPHRDLEDNKGYAATFDFVPALNVGDLQDSKGYAAHEVGEQQASTMAVTYVVSRLQKK